MGLNNPLARQVVVDVTFAVSLPGSAGHAVVVVVYRKVSKGWKTAITSNFSVLHLLIANNIGPAGVSTAERIVAVIAVFTIITGGVTIFVIIVINDAFSKFKSVLQRSNLALHIDDVLLSDFTLGHKANSPSLSFHKWQVVEKAVVVSDASSVLDCCLLICKLLGVSLSKDEVVRVDLGKHEEHPVLGGWLLNDEGGSTMNVLLFGVISERKVQDLSEFSLLGREGAGFHSGDMLALKHPELLVYDTDHELRRHKDVFAWGQDVLVELQGDIESILVSNNL